MLLYSDIIWLESMESRVAVRLTAELLDNAKTVKSKSESLNDLVVLTIEREVRYCQGLTAHQRILAISKQLLIQPDATELIHKLREGEERDA